MKKTLILMSVISLISCTEYNNQQDQKREYEAKMKELKCKSDFSKFLLNNGMNTMYLLKRKYNDEYNSFQKLKSDSTSTCKEIRSEWTRLSSMSVSN